MLANILEYYQKSDGKTKNKIPGCILSEKISFDENKDAAISFVTPVTILLNAGKGLVKGKKEKEVKNDLLSYVAPPVIKENELYYFYNNYSIDNADKITFTELLPDSFYNINDITFDTKILAGIG